MSDSEIRDAERTYRASGAPQDGEAYVQAVLRSTGLNSTFLIARVIETQRGLNTLLAINELRMPGGVTLAMREAIQRTVTPDDMVSFLRGGREWLEPPSIMRGQQGTDFLAVERPAIHPAQVTAHSCMICGAFYSGLTHTCVGRNPTGAYDAVPTRGVPAGSAILCNHANENPGHCPCDLDCYCRQDGNTCSDVRSMEPNDGTCEIRGCRRCPRWHFRTERGAQLSNGVLVYYVCTEHLAEIRANNSLSEIVRHHEVVDDV